MGLVDTEDGIKFAPHVNPNELAAKAAAEAVPANHFTPLLASGSFDISEAAHSTASSSSSSSGAAATKKKRGSGSSKTITPDLLPQQEGAEILEIPDLSLTSTLSTLMGETDLVDTEDLDLVPDYLFLAMSQLKPCELSEQDKVGCYKDRDIGFSGMACKHCGGQPGFGKYFPATVRSLAQTTTSQTILKHVGQKCRMCPPNIRNSILALQGQEDAEKSTYARGPCDDGRPRYGSRKVFFQRVWARLHGEPVPALPSGEELAALSAPNKKARKKSATKKSSATATATTMVVTADTDDAAPSSSAATQTTPGLSLITPNCSEDSNENVAVASASDEDSITHEARDRTAEEEKATEKRVVEDLATVRVTIRVGDETYFNGKWRQDSFSSLEESSSATHQAPAAKKVRV